MIYSLQKRFIRITAFSIAFVFALIFLLISLISSFQTNGMMDSIADLLSQNGGRFPDRREAPGEPPHTPDDMFFSPEAQFSIRFFVVWTDQNGRITRENTEQASSVSEEEIQDYTDRVLDRGKERGWIDGYRYKNTDTDHGKLIVFINGETNIGMTRQFLFTVTLVMAASFLVILLLIIIISKRAVRPVAQLYDRQKQFVTDANHELKTPLTLILSNLDIIESVPAFRRPAAARGDRAGPCEPAVHHPGG